jgi:hypothetical protein
MKKILFILLLIPFALAAQDNAPRKKVLIKAYLDSSSQYVIIARGYPKPDITDPVKAEGTAREAAVLNAQVLAKERFIDTFDVVTNGRASEFKEGDGYVDVVYLVEHPNIQRFLKKR